jgi:pimeloyl-ACP methyl ester carboxylesterase
MRTPMRAVCLALLALALPSPGRATQAPASGSFLKAHQGFWLGARTNPNGTSTQVGLEIYTRADGSLWARVGQPEFGNHEIPVKSVVETKEGIEVALFPPITLKLTWVGDHFEGAWQSPGRELPLNLKPVPAFPEKARPQAPQAPFPYREETLAIPSTEGVTLGATLTLPQGVARPVVVVLVHGSGPHNRDESADGHRPFAVLADHLARKGVAVLRYDKRGVSRSTGNYDQHTREQLISDIHAVLQALKARKQFKAMGLLGHSEGPGLAAAVAARHPESVDFLVSLAGVGLPGLDMMLVQDRSEAVANGATPEEADVLVAYSKKHYDLVVATADPKARVAAVAALIQASPRERALLAKLEMGSPGGTLSLESAGEPSLRDLLVADPTTDWRKVRCPVLALNGSLDVQVPPRSLEGLARALKAGGNAKVETAVIPGLNHGFQTAKTGRVEEYGELTETLAPVALEHIAAFIRKQR